MVRLEERQKAVAADEEQGQAPGGLRRGGRPSGMRSRPISPASTRSWRVGLPISWPGPSRPTRSAKPSIAPCRRVGHGWAASTS